MNRAATLAVLVIFIAFTFTSCSSQISDEPTEISRDAEKTVVTSDKAKVEAEKPAGIPSPPGQPEKGPGGAAYAHETVIENTYGKGGTQYWLFEPDSPKPEKAPVIVFNHGWAGMLPSVYKSWIEHIVRRGNIVIFPRYQASIVTLPRKFTPNAVTSIKAALKELESGKHVKPDTEKVAVVGHSMGGAISANLAAIAEKEGLPKFKAVVCVEPGMGPARILEDCSKIPADTLLIIIAGEDDKFVGDKTSKDIFNGATNVKKENKNYIILPSDSRGEPALKSDHMVPIEGRVDALAWYGYWKWFDALCDAAFYNKNRKHALGNTPEQRFMGKWSDGTPVKEAEITDSP